MEKKQCCVQVYPKERWGAFYGHICDRNATIERDGKHYCTIHDPVRTEKKAEERDKKWEEERKLRNEKWRRDKAMATACEDVPTEVLEKIKVKDLLKDFA